MSVRMVFRQEILFARVAGLGEGCCLFLSSGGGATCSSRLFHVNPLGCLDFEFARPMLFSVYDVRRSRTSLNSNIDCRA